MKLEVKGKFVLLHVKAVPNSSRTQLAGLLGDALKIKVAQPPEDGKANRGIERLLADLLQIARSNVTVVAGHSRPQKTVQIAGVSMDRVRAMLQSHLPSK